MRLKQRLLKMTIRDMPCGKGAGFSDEIETSDQIRTSQRLDVW